LPKLPRPAGQVGKAETADGVASRRIVLQPQPGLPLPAVVRSGSRKAAKGPGCVLLHLGGKAEALRHVLAGTLVAKGWTVVAPDLRATGETRPADDAIHGAPDHNSAEHGLWVGRPLLGPWVFDVWCVLDWLGRQPGVDSRRLTVAGLGQAGLVALCAAGLLEDWVASAAAIDCPATYVTEAAYADGFSMGVLAPGILRLGDVPHLAALVAPRRLIIAGGVSPQGEKRSAAQIEETFGFTRGVYKLHKEEAKLALMAEVKAADVAAGL
jgi:pimeloyl-ACP methyl ester carboxylesterase